MTAKPQDIPTIRPFRDDDAADAARVFFDAVHHAPGNGYDAAQLRAWAAAVPDTRTWRARLASQACFVADRQGAVIGFMTVDRDGYVDLAFVAPRVMGTGIARRLHDAVEAQARQWGCVRMHARASPLARRFFERQGWSVMREQTVTRSGVRLTNFVMEKTLS